MFPVHNDCPLKAHETAGSYANTLNPLNPDAVAVVTTPRPTATVIVDAPRNVSLLGPSPPQLTERNLWKVATEGLVADVMSLTTKRGISAVKSVYALMATVSLAFHVMLDQRFYQRPSST